MERLLNIAVLYAGKVIGMVHECVWVSFARNKNL